jgi:negative regulator of flagellin synthesis FlgM
MTINGINPIEPVSPNKKPGQNSRVSTTAEVDSISLSSEAVKKGEMYQVLELVNAAADIQTDRIEELKKKINDPSYINETIIRATADKIMNAFGI